MTLSEFESAVESAKLPAFAFSVSDADGWDLYGIGSRSNGWELYYSERGERRPIRFFADEASALTGLYNQLISEFTRHLPMRESRAEKISDYYDALDADARFVFLLS